MSHTRPHFKNVGCNLQSIRAVKVQRPSHALRTAAACSQSLGQHPGCAQSRHWQLKRLPPPAKEVHNGCYRISQEHPEEACRTEQRAAEPCLQAAAAHGHCWIRPLLQPTCRPCAFAICTAALPTPPAAACTSTRCPCCRRAALSAWKAVSAAQSGWEDV